MKLKICGILLGILAIGSIPGAKVQSNETFKTISTETLLALEINKIKQVHDRNNSKQQPPLIDRQLFFGNPEISGAQLSPDGKYLAIRKPLNGVLNIWVKGIDEPMSAARPVTENKNSPIIDYYWSQDSKHILFVQDSDGNENYRIYAVSPQAKFAPNKIPTARNLTPYSNVRANIIATPENTPNTIIIGLNDRDPRYDDVYRLNIATGSRELIFKNDRNVAIWLTDLTGNLRLGVRLLSDGGTEILRVDGNQLTPVYRCNFVETCTLIEFHKDGKRVYMKTNKGDNVDLIRLVLFDPQTKEIEEIESDPKKKVDIDSLFFSHTEDLVATYYIGDRQRVYPKTKEFAATLSFLKKALPAGDFNIKSMSEDGRLMVVVQRSDINPASIYLYDRQNQEITLLYLLKPKLKQEYLAPTYPIRYNARDGLSIPAYLTLPLGKTARNLPVVVYVHGGPWSRDTWEYDSMVQLLANRGYAVLQPNFRGSTGYGKAFLNAGNREWGRAMQHDITDGVKYLIEQKIADPKGIAIYGASYGGYATLAGLTFDSDLYAAGISYVGVSNLITFLDSFPPHWESAKAMFKLRVGEIETNRGRELMRSRSPLFSADQIQAPLMVIHGANDPRVKQAESDQIVGAVRNNNTDVKYLLAPDEGHGFRKETNKLAVAAAIERFLARHLQGRYQKSISSEVKEKLEALTVDINTVEVSQ